VARFSARAQGGVRDFVRAVGDAVRRRMQSSSPSDNSNAVAQTAEVADKLKEDLSQMKL